MLKLKKIVNESKQVGDIYHVCTLESVINYIVPTDTLSSSGRYYNSVFNSNNVVSFTRDKNYLPPVAGSSCILFQFVVDGNKLSENHKIKPYNNKTKILGFSEAEESVLGSIKNFRKYIKKVNFYITEELVDYLDGKKDIHFLLLNLWSIDDYLKGIITEKMEKGTYFSGWMNTYHYEDSDEEYLFEKVRDSKTFFVFCSSLQEFAN